jgi:hypothetical protein
LGLHSVSIRPKQAPLALRNITREKKTRLKIPSDRKYFQTRFILILFSLHHFPKRQTYLPGADSKT